MNTLASDVRRRSRYGKLPGAKCVTAERKRATLESATVVLAKAGTQVVNRLMHSATISSSLRASSSLPL